MNTGLKDAYRETNWRPGPTWSPFNWLPSILRIDYIFVSSIITAKSAWTLSLPGSDHRGVIADIEITDFENNPR